MSIGADDNRVLFNKFEGWMIDPGGVDVAPDATLVVRLRAPDGRTSWVALLGAFGQTSIAAWELNPGHRLLLQIEAAKRAKAVADRLAMQADRRAILAESSDRDECPPFGMLRPPLEVAP